MAQDVTHSVSLMNRELLEISGVNGVLIFDTDYILMELVNSRLAVEGSDLKLLNLIQDKKEVRISGRISGVFYQEAAEKRNSFFKKK